MRLFQNEVSERDIVAISELFKASSSPSINNVKEAQSLICDVWKYIDLKSIIKELTQQAGKLRKEVFLLQSQKEIMSTHNKNNYNNNNDGSNNYYSHQEHEPLEQTAKSNAWDYLKAWATQASSDDHIDSKEHNMKSARPRVPKPKPLKIAWQPIDYDVKKTILKRDTNLA